MTALDRVQIGGDGEVDRRHERGDLHRTVADDGLAAEVEPRGLGLEDLDGTTALVLVPLAVPGDLGGVGALGAEDDPGVVLGERQVDVGDLEELAGGHDGEGHAEAVELVA